MKSLTSTAIAALAAGLIGLSSVPAATAQQQPPVAPGQQMPQQMQPFGHGQFNHRPGMGFRNNGGGMQMGKMGNQMRGNGPGGLMALVCSDRGAERLEIGFVRLKHSVELTADQQPLFDDLQTTALTAQTQFADACKAARPASGTAAAGQPATAPDPVAGLKARVELDKARLAAMETVLPKFEAFFNSLTDAQKAQLGPQQGKGRAQGFRHQRPGFPGMPGAPGMMNPPAQPGQPAAPQGDAPAAPAAPQG